MILNREAPVALRSLCLCLSNKPALMLSFAVGQIDQSIPMHSVPFYPVSAHHSSIYLLNLLIACGTHRPSFRATLKTPEWVWFRDNPGIVLRVGRHPGVSRNSDGRLPEREIDAHLPEVHPRGRCPAGMPALQFLLELALRSLKPTARGQKPSQASASACLGKALSPLLRCRNQDTKKTSPRFSPCCVAVPPVFVCGALFEKFRSLFGSGWEHPWSHEGETP